MKKVEEREEKQNREARLIAGHRKMA